MHNIIYHTRGITLKRSHTEYTRGEMRGRKNVNCRAGGVALSSRECGQDVYMSPVYSWSLFSYMYQLVLDLRLRARVRRTNMSMYSTYRNRCQP